MTNSMVDFNSDDTKDINQASLELHRQFGGKLGIVSKVPILSKNELSLLYTPGVGAVSQVIAKDPSLAFDLTLKGNSVAVISDGSAVLGLGNLGAKAAIPVMEGKAVLFKEFADIDAFPICLDTQDTEEIIKTIKLIAPVFGGINLEDISAPRCFEIEQRLKAELDIPVMHDDQHGTAVVVLAGLINALKVRGLDKETAKIVVNGAGAAGIAVSDLLIQYGFRNIIICDSQGAIFERRENVEGKKLDLAKQSNKDKIAGDLATVLTDANIFVGVSKGNLLTTEMIQKMAERPIIFALANPIPEIMPDIAKAAGAFIVATGRSDFPNQINNVLAFPGIFRGALDNRVRLFTDQMFIAAAEALAGCVKDLGPDQVLPSVFDKAVVKVVASAFVV